PPRARAASIRRNGPRRRAVVAPTARPVREAGEPLRRHTTGRRRRCLRRPTPRTGSRTPRTGTRRSASPTHRSSPHDGRRSGRKREVSRAMHASTRLRRLKRASKLTAGTAIVTALALPGAAAARPGTEVHPRSLHLVTSSFATRGYVVNVETFGHHRV